MAVTNGYTDLKEYKNRFEIDDNEDDSDIESCEAVIDVLRTLNN